MDFINSHKTMLAAFGAVIVVAGVSYFFNRQKKSKEAVPISIVDEANLNGVNHRFNSKIQQIRSNIREGRHSDEVLVGIARQFVDYIIQRTRDNYRQDYFKAKDSNKKNRFPKYVEMILLWEKEKETQNESLFTEHKKLIQSFNLNQNESATVDQHIQEILSQIIAQSVTQRVLAMAKEIISYKNEYLKRQGENKIVQFTQICKSWDAQSLKYLPNILNVIIDQQVYTNHPQLLDYQLEINWALQSFNEELKNELSQWENTISHLYEKLLNKVSNQ